MTTYAPPKLTPESHRLATQAPMPDEAFDTKQVMRITGVTARMLQWWDEIELISPLIRGHRRIYSLDDVLKVSLVGELRRKRVPLQLLRGVLAKHWSKLSAGLRTGKETYLLMDDDRMCVATDYKLMIEFISQAANPVLTVCLSDHVRFLSVNKGLRKPVQSERML